MELIANANRADRCRKYYKNVFKPRLQAIEKAVVKIQEIRMRRQLRLFENLRQELNEIGIEEFSSKYGIKIKKVKCYDL